MTPSPKPWERDWSVPPPAAPAAPAPGIGQQLLDVGKNTLKDVGSAVYNTAAGANQLAANLAMMGGNVVKNTAGIEAAAPFRNLEGILRQNQEAQQLEAQRLAGNRNDLASQLNRGLTQGVLQAPQYMVAGELAGPIMGMAAIGGISEADKGWRAALQGAAEGALTGGALHVMGPASRPVRTLSAGIMAGTQALANGADLTTALAHATTMGMMAGHAPGGVPAREFVPGLDATMTAAGRAADATRAGVRAGGADVAKGAAKLGAGYALGEMIPGLGPLKYAVELPTAAAGGLQMRRGLKKGMTAARAAYGESAPTAPEAAAAAPPAAAPTLTLDDVLMLRHLGEDNPQAADPETVNVARQLAAQHPELLDKLRAGAAEGFAAPPTAAEAAAPTTQSLGTLEYNAPGAAPPATTPGPGEEGAAPAPVPPAEPPPPPGGGATPVPPKGAEIAAQLEQSMRAETLTDYLVRNKIPGEMVAEFGPKEWEMVSQQAGVQPPTPEHIDAIRRNLAEYEGASTITAKTTEGAAAEFEVKKKVRAKRKPPPEPPAAPEVTLPAGQTPAQALADLMGPQPPVPAAGEPAPTASEIRVEGLAKHLAEDQGINLEDLKTVAEKPAALAQLDKLREALGIDGAVIGYELPQIIDRVRELRGEPPAAPAEGAPAGEAAPPAAAAPVTEAGLRDLFTRPDDVAAAASERMRKRGTFSGQKANLGIDPEDIADLTLWGAAKIVKGAQKIHGGVTDFKTWANEMAREYGERIIPHLDRLWKDSQEMAGRAGQDVKRRTMENLDVRIPDEQRVVSPDPTKTVDGKEFHSLDLNQKSEGFLPRQKYGDQKANEMVNQFFDEAIKETEAAGGTTAADTIRKIGAKPPDAKFWDESFSLRQQARYWYELSAEAFMKKYMDISQAMQAPFIDAVAGTSGGVEPLPNLRRAIGITAENMQKQPVMTDLRDPASARKALDPEGKSAKTLKYGSFAGTMQYLAGLIKKAPLTTNDVQVGSMFGVKGSDIGGNPVVYEVLSRFFMKMRDAQNAELPAGAQPWETWQMQAPSWVNERIRKDPSKASEYDDYSAVFPTVIKQLQDAGVPTPGGKITVETLMDPRTPDVMSGTRKQFQKSPWATVEVASNQTPEGKAAADLYAQVKQFDPVEHPWARIAHEDYEQIQRNHMQAIGKRIGSGEDKAPSLISQLMSAVLGKDTEVSRIDWKGYGTFGGAINPNVRIPLTGRQGTKWRNLTKAERETFLAMLGQDLNQDAMAASHFKAVEEGAGNTYSVFLNRYDGKVDTEGIRSFSEAIGLPVNVTQHPNGTVIDVNVFKGMEGPGPQYQDIARIAEETFGGDDNVKELEVVPRNRSGDYITDRQYQNRIDKHAEKRAAKSETGDAGAVGSEGTTVGEPDNLGTVREAIRQTSRERDAAFADWTKSTRERLDKELGRRARNEAEAAAKTQRETERATRRAEIEAETKARAERVAQRALKRQTLKDLMQPQ